MFHFTLQSKAPMRHTRLLLLLLLLVVLACDLLGVVSKCQGLGSSARFVRLRSHPFSWLPTRLSQLPRCLRSLWRATCSRACRAVAARLCAFFCGCTARASMSACESAAVPSRVLNCKLVGPPVPPLFMSVSVYSSAYVLLATRAGGTHSTPQNAHTNSHLKSDQSLVINY